MRVVHVLETLSPNYGGPVSVLKQLVEEQARSGMDVQVLTTNANYPKGIFHPPGWYVLGEAQVPVYYGSVEVPALKVSFGFAREFNKVLKTADVIHVHGLYRFPPSYAAFAARRASKPYIVRPFGSLDPFLYSKSSRSVLLKRLYERLIDFPNLRQASALHFTATEEMRRAAYIGSKGRSFVIPNPIDLSRYDVLPTRGRLREMWGIGNAPMVLFLGRLHHKKGLDLLIPAFKTVLARVPDARLVIAGPENDDWGAGMRALATELGLSNSVLFCGPLHGPDVTQAYVDADVFALTSYTENFGMTVVEAMAAGTPVLISDQVNISEDLAADSAALVVKCDIREIAEGLLDLLSNGERRRLLARRGADTVRDRYSLPAVSSDLQSQYAALM